MKHSPSSLFTAILLSAALCACNGDVFVDEMKPSLTQAELNGDGDTLTIRFNTADWQLYEAYQTEDADGSLRYFHGNYYTLDGTDMGTATGCRLDAPGKIVVKDLPGELAFIRPADKELQVCIGDNVTRLPFRFTLRVSDKNLFKEQELHFTQQPGSDYAFDKMEYELIPGTGYTNIVEEAYLFDYNSGESPEVHELDVFWNIKRYISFSSGEPLAFQLPFSAPVTVNIPEADTTQGLRPGKERLPYLPEKQEMAMTFPEKLQKVTVQPGYTQIRRLTEYHFYQARYTLTAHNVKTGRQRTVKGILQSQTPTGWAMLIVPKKER